ncbi:hypothetical protein DPMN_023563 [Dreissena polymorpha]|uniref:Uncharacterized protein n=1 Tax=Dreissena polymorpha TaxID=45954 RepID=A0A9D4RAU5_DREPO|nr:hypothetical protein DPMN_023563 [Dreissena polymorpha]
MWTEYCSDLYGSCRCRCSIRSNCLNKSDLSLLQNNPISVNQTSVSYRTTQSL